jgi:hypothetical protein
MYLEDRGLVYDATRQSAVRRIAFFPSLCLLESGAILCAFEVGSAKHAIDSTIGLCRSLDGGATWREESLQLATELEGVPGSLAGPELLELRPGHLILFATWFDRSDPDRPLFDPVTEGILHSKLLLAESRDGGTSFSDWSILPTPGLAGCAGTGPMVRWPQGPLVCAFESFKEFDDPRPARHAAWIVQSRDDGQTFGDPLLVAQDPNAQVYYWDQRLCSAGRAGDLIALFWTHDRAQKRDLNVHLRRATLIDGALRTGPMQATTMRGQIAAPLAVDDRCLLAFVVDRTRPGTMTLWTSRDFGQTWPQTERLVVHRHDDQAAAAPQIDRIDFAQYWEDMGKWTFGHPVIRRLDRRRVLLAFYAGTPQAMSIHWARVCVDSDPLGLAERPTD